jgi:DNA polymerase alpha subunit B
MAEDTAVELNKLFNSGAEGLDGGVISELQSIMRLHNLSAEDTFFKWESYCINRDMDQMTLSIDALRPFKQDLMDSLQRSTRPHAVVKTEKRVGATPRTVAKTTDVLGMLDGLTSTPATARNRSAQSKKRHLETPTVSRLKGNVPSSSPDFKSPRLDDQHKALG